MSRQGLMDDSGYDFFDVSDCANYESCREDAYNDGYTKGRTDALNIDMEKPMHFTDEQKAWVKNYIIINAKRQRADAIDEFVNECVKFEDLTFDREHIRRIKLIAEQLKEQNK